MVGRLIMSFEIAGILSSLHGESFRGRDDFGFGFPQHDNGSEISWWVVVVVEYCLIFIGFVVTRYDGFVESVGILTGMHIRVKYVFNVSRGWIRVQIS